MTVLQEKNENLNLEIKELESYLHNRPSREEDLGEIAKLQKELKHKTKELKDLKAFIASTNGITSNTPNNNNNNINPIQQNDGLSNKVKTLKALAAIKEVAKPKYTNASYGMIFSKK
jgi:hypothetical protein